MAKKAIEIANEALSLVQRGGISVPRDTPGLKFGSAKHGVFISEESLDRYRGLVEHFFRTDKDIYESYSKKTLENKFILAITRVLYDDSKFNDNNVKGLFSELKKEPLQNYYVSRNIYGVKLDDGCKSFEIGAYHIYTREEHVKKLMAITSFEEHVVSHKEMSNYFIETAIQSRDSEKALEVADARFDRFEKILSFMVGHRSDQYNASIIKYDSLRVATATICSANGTLCQNSESQGATKSIPVQDHFFRSAKLGFDRVWEMTKKEFFSEIENRILLAMEWIGQSYKEASPASAFLNSAISLEILLNYSEKTIVTPSILNQISESAAIILGKDLESRLRLESDTKRLYGVRSSIAHAGKNNISMHDIEQISGIARATVIYILTLPELRNINSVAELHDKIKRIKYSGASLHAVSEASRTQ